MVHDRAGELSLVSFFALLVALSCAGPPAAKGEPAPEPVAAPPGMTWSEAWGGSAQSAASAAPSAVPASAPAWRERGLPEFAARGDAAAEEAMSLRLRLRTARLQGLEVTDEESLRAVARRVADATGLPIVVHPSAEEAVIDAGVVFELRLEHALLAKDVLNLVAHAAGEEVVWTVKHGVVLFTTKGRDADRTVLVMHDVRGLTTPRTDFLGPRIDRIRLLDELEDDDGGGPFGGVGERVTQYTADDLATMIQESVASGTWEDEGVSIEPYEGYLLVRHTREVQQQVRTFLAVLSF